MTSFMQILQCMGLSGNIQIVRDFFGYRFYGYKGTISLIEQIRLLQADYVDLNFIRAGIENFTIGNEKELDYAIQITRQRYAQVNFGIGIVHRRYLTAAQVQEALTVDLGDGWVVLLEVDELPDKFYTPNEAIDIFFVLAWDSDPETLVKGRSPVDGPCDKQSPFETTGAVISMEDNKDQTAKHVAHELGHYLGLPHAEEDFMVTLEVWFSVSGNSDEFTNLLGHNLMASGDYITELGIPTVDAYLLIPYQGYVIKQHCFVKHGCP